MNLHSENEKTNRWIGLLILIFVLAGCAKNNTMKTIKILELKTNEVTLDKFLIEMHEKLGCHFTFEKLTASDHASFLTARSAIGVLIDSGVTNVSLLVTKLRHDSQGCLVVQSKSNPRILHIIEAPLMNLKDYAMEKRLDVTYSGDLGSGKDGGLVVEISKQLDGIGPRTHGDNTTAFDDHVTKVTVNVKNEKIRDILTDCVPVTNYSSSLWVAETTLVGGKSKTVVQYFGPKRNQ